MISIMYWINPNVSICLGELQTIRQVYWSHIVNLESVAYNLERRYETVKMEVTRLNTHSNTQPHIHTHKHPLSLNATHLAAVCGGEWKFYIRFETKMTFDWIGLNNWLVFDIVCWAGFFFCYVRSPLFLLWNWSIQTKAQNYTQTARTPLFSNHTHTLFFFRSTPRHTSPRPAVLFFVLVSIYVPVVAVAVFTFSFFPF